VAHKGHILYIGSKTPSDWPPVSAGNCFESSTHQENKTDTTDPLLTNADQERGTGESSRVHDSLVAAPEVKTVGRRSVGGQDLRRFGYAQPSSQGRSSTISSGKYFMDASTF
jgi:hypothetical protein